MARTYDFLYVKEVAVKTMPDSEPRARYAEVLASVTDDREEVVITRAGHDPVVIVSLEDYESLKASAPCARWAGASASACCPTTCRCGSSDSARAPTRGGVGARAFGRSGGGVSS